MLERIKLGVILFLHEINTSLLTWKEINKIMDEEKAAHLKVLSHVC